MDSLRYNSATSRTRSAAGLRPEAGSSYQHEQESAEQGSADNDQYLSMLDGAELDEEEEEQEGIRQEEELLNTYPLWRCQEATLTLTEILEEMKPRSRRREISYEFVALDAAIPFASSCTHGTVYFSRAMMENLSRQSLCFYGAHEMAHTELRHFATRRRRLDDLRRSMPAAPGTPARQRMELAAVLAVRHQEEFEADALASQWTSCSVGELALGDLYQVCQMLSPASLGRSSHPSFPTRIQRLRQGAPPEPLEYLWSLLG